MQIDEIKSAISDHLPTNYSEYSRRFLEEHNRNPSPRMIWFPTPLWCSDHHMLPRLTMCPDLPGNDPCLHLVWMSEKDQSKIALDSEADLFMKRFPVLLPTKDMPDYFEAISPHSEMFVLFVGRVDLGSRSNVPVISLHIPSLYVEPIITEIVVLVEDGRLVYPAPWSFWDD